jgi:hypothetical protein
VTPYYYLAACYAHMDRHNDAQEVFRQLTTLTPPMLDPPVIMPQQPAQRTFFLASYRLAMQATAGPHAPADTAAERGR